MLVLFPLGLVDLQRCSTPNWTLLQLPIINFTKWLKVMNVHIAFNYFPFQLSGFSFEIHLLG